MSQREVEPPHAGVADQKLGPVECGSELRVAARQKAILAIIRSWRPDLLEEFGIGPIVAATVLCAWSHPGRIHSEAAFAMLAGVEPIPANSGQITTRYRLVTSIAYLKTRPQLLDEA